MYMSYLEPKRQINKKGEGFIELKSLVHCAGVCHLKTLQRKKNVLSSWVAVLRCDKIMR